VIALVNKSSQVANDEVALIAQACAAQLAGAGPRWQKNAEAVIFYADPAQVPPRTKTITFMDNADQAGVLGWHSEENGVPMGRVFTEPSFAHGSTNAFNGPYPPSTTASHEVLELWGDPDTQLYAYNYGDGKLYAVELCDSVESDSYLVNVYDKAGTLHKIPCSNYVLPSFFDATALNAPYDRLGKLTAPFTMTRGGYMIVLTAGSESQVQAEPIYGDEYPDWKKELKSEYGRTAQRIQAVVALGS